MMLGSGTIPGIIMHFRKRELHCVARSAMVGQSPSVLGEDIVRGIMFRAIQTLHGERVLSVVDKQMVTKVYLNTRHAVDHLKPVRDAHHLFALSFGVEHWPTVPR